MVTTTESEFVAANREGHTQWVVTLNDGTKCYQDDGREDCPTTSSWLRLRNFCQVNGLYIVSMYLRFRTENIHLPADKDGYYFCNSVLSWLNDSKMFHYYVVGYIENGVIYTKKYKIPELIVEEEDVRTIRTDDICLIQRKNNDSSSQAS